MSAKKLNTTKPTLERLRADGYTVQVVEVWLPWCKRKRDFCNFADVLAFKGGTPGALAIQTTSRDNVAARVRKCLLNDAAREWLRAGNRLEVWGWYKVAVGRRKELRVTVRRLSLAAAPPAPEEKPEGPAAGKARGEEVCELPQV